MISTFVTKMYYKIYQKITLINFYQFALRNSISPCWR